MYHSQFVRQQQQIWTHRQAINKGSSTLHPLKYLLLSAPPDDAGRAAPDVQVVRVEESKLLAAEFAPVQDLLGVVDVHEEIPAHEEAMFGTTDSGGRRFEIGDAPAVRYVYTLDNPFRVRVFRHLIADEQPLSWSCIHKHLGPAKVFWNPRI